MELGSTGVFDRKAYITTYVVRQTRSVLDRNLNFAYCTPTKHTHLMTIRRRTGYMLNCERGVGQGRQSLVDGGKLNPISIPSPRWNPGGAEGAITNSGSGSKGSSGGGGSGRTKPCDALSTRALFQELGVTMAVWHHSALAVRYPRLVLDCTMGQLTVIMGGWMMLSSMTSTSITRMWPGGGGGSVGSNCGRCRDDGNGRLVAANWVGWQQLRRGSDAKCDKERRHCGERVAIQQPAGAREMVAQ